MDRTGRPFNRVVDAFAYGGSDTRNMSPHLCFLCMFVIYVQHHLAWRLLLFGGKEAK